MFSTSSDIVGRDQAVRELDAFVAGRELLPAVLLVEGQAGIGKTLLWRHGVERATAGGYTVLACTPGSSEVQLSFAGLADLVGTLLPDVASDLPGPQRRALEVALLLSDPDEPGRAADPRVVAAAFRSTIALLADQRPVLLAVDDLQWLDRSTASVLEFAARRLESSAASLLLTRRTEAEQAWPLALDRALEPIRLQRLWLGPLSLGATHRLLQSRLGLTLGRPLLRRVHEASAGNPFYALELGRALAAGTIQPRPGEPLPVPPTLHDLLRARLRRLPPETREALLIAAALPYPTLPAVADALEDNVLEILEPAVDAQLVRLVAGRIEFS